MQPKWDDTEEIAPSWDDTTDLQEQPQTSQLESGALGAVDSASLGFADEIYGGVKGGLQALTGPRDFADTYEEARNEARDKFKNAEQANPGSYLSGQIAGGVASSFIPGLNIAKGASLAKVAGQSALMGGLAGAGAAEELSDVPTNVGIGVVGGGLAGTAGYKASEGIQKLAKSGMFPKIADKLGMKAEEAAAQGLGLERGTFKKMGEDKVRQVGRYALDEGVVDAGLRTGKNPLNLVTGSAATDAMQSANQSAISKAGAAREGIYDAIEESGFGKINPQKFADQLEQQLGNFNRQSPLNAAKEAQLQKTIGAIRARGDQPIGIKELQNLVEELQGASKFEMTRETGANELAKQASRLARGEVNETAANLAGEIGVPGAKEIVTGANKTMSSGFSAQKLLENRLAREQGNQILGLGDSIIGGSTAIAGAAATGGAGVLAGLGGIATNKAVNKYGALAGASLMNSLSKVAMEAPKTLGKYGPILQQAAQRGNHSLAVTNYLLQQKEPEYREQIRQLEQDDER